MKRKILISVFTIIAVFGYQKIQEDFEKTTNTVYVNGNIITLEDDYPIAQAMFVKDGKIEAIGKNEDVALFKNKNNTVVDLKGATILPGFIDPHTHVALSAFLDGMIDLSGFKHRSNKEVWNYLKEQIKTKKEGEWVVCKGLDPVLVEDLKTPHIAFLDEIAPKNPIIIISQSLHSYWVNSLTFKKANIDKTSKNPSKTSYYDKDENGNLTGFIAEQEAIHPILTLMKKEYLTSKMLIKSTTAVLNKYAKNGNTTVVSQGIYINDKKPLRLYKHLSEETPSFINQLFSSFGILPERKQYPRHFIYVRYDKAFLLPSEKREDDFYAIIGIKHWYDGSPYTGSMFIKEPYLVSNLTKNEFRIKEGYTGKPLIKKSDLVNFIEKYTQKGWQISVHTQGDIANENVLNAFKEVNTHLNIQPFRHRIEHCLLVSDTTLLAMKELNMTPSFHINHLYYYGKALSNDILGKERTQKILPVSFAQKIGLKYSLHADQPMFESNPFRLMQTSIERQTKEGDTIGLSYQISLLNALKAMTIHAAWQIHMEDKIGSLKKGKYADFIIVDKNVLQIPTSELENVNVLKTFINGNEVK
ncbi:amidohydrolase [Lutibacter sp.]